MACALIALGANLDQRRKTLKRAIATLGGHPEIAVARKSRYYESLPAGGPVGQGLFLNAAAVLETTLAPETLLAELLTVEDQLGRTRNTRWDARTIDLDLLLYDDAVIETKTLILPHPRMSYRRFVLEPAAEIVPDMRHPTIGWTISELLEHLDSAAPSILVIVEPGPEMESLVEAIREFAVDQLGSPSQRLHALSMTNHQVQPTDGPFTEEAAALSGNTRLGPPTKIGTTVSVLAGLPAEIPLEFKGRPPRLSVLLYASNTSSWRNVPIEGPVLRLGNVSRESAIAEVTAAIESMKRLHAVV